MHLKSLKCTLHVVYIILIHFVVRKPPNMEKQVINAIHLKYSKQCNAANNLCWIFIEGGGLSV